MRLPLIAAVALTLVGSALAAGSREVEGRTLRSADAPALEMTAGDRFHYEGRVPFRLATSEGERYVFVDAEPDKTLKRLLIVQFESFLPSSSEKFRYDLSSGRAMAGLRFVANTFAFPATDKIVASPKDEGESTNNFLLEHGFKMPTVWLAARHVTITDGSRRKSEMIVFYMEARSDLTMADLYDGENPTSTWHGEEPFLEERSRRNFTITKPH